MKDIRQMAENGIPMKEILEYVNTELDAVSAIIEKKKKEAEKAAQQKHATDIVIDALIGYVKAFDLIPADAEATPSLKEMLTNVLTSSLSTSLNPQVKKIEKDPRAQANKIETNPHTVEIELDEKELDDLIKKIFG